ncbi:hypothetical protein [Oceanirhabdus seepicola]|uniref:Uncharacterized protein n=1 Tax=Oceanirhabdus seepicola TaxID=2828781 RepID=A0A9J6P0L3_9CLOT|nr:hypothetical protein [Oceanirhabdus seepicola]MCM1989437.1 hypothetical protein [Oceanirhabdus seepicola]
MEIQSQDEFNELIKKVPFSEDDYWIYFGHGEGWGNKCSSCYYTLKVDRKPNKECINCWKFEIWEENLTNIEETLLFLLEESDKDHTLSGKMMKDKSLIFEEVGSRLGSGISHSFPEEAKPDSYLRGEIDSDRVILIYSQSIEERDMRMEKLLKGLKERGLYKKESFPYRRGCIEPHEKLIGPWEKWFSMEKDYIE